MNDDLSNLRLRMADAIELLAPEGFKDWAQTKKKELKKRKINNLLRRADIRKSKRMSMATGKERSLTFMNMNFQSFEDFMEEKEKKRRMTMDASRRNSGQLLLSNFKDQEIVEEESQDSIEINSDDSFGD